MYEGKLIGAADHPSKGRRMDRMADRKSRRMQNIEFLRSRSRATRDRYTAARNPDLDDITISDEEIDRAMRVYTPGEAMDLLICGTPGRSASTRAMQDFLVLMRRRRRRGRRRRGRRSAGSRS